MKYCPVTFYSSGDIKGWLTSESRVNSELNHTEKKVVALTFD